MARARLLRSAAVACLCVTGSAARSSETITYTYDVHGRLTKVEHAGSVNAGVKAEYTYDAADNRTNKTVSGVTVSPTISISDATVSEGSQATFSISMSVAAAAPVSVNYATVADTASASDFMSKSGVLTFAAGVTNLQMVVDTTDDSAVEASETFNVQLSGNTPGTTLGKAVGVGTINDNDLPGLTISDPTVVEGGYLTFQVTISDPATVSVNYSVAAASTATANSDYDPISAGTLNFTPSVTTRTISVKTTDDAVAGEVPETVLIDLSAPTGATIVKARGTGTIDDNDSLASFSIGDAAAVEGGVLSYTINKNGAGAASITYSITGGTAVAGSDYTSASGTLTFSSSEPSKSIDIQTLDDAAWGEGAETVFIDLSNPTGASISDGQAQGIISDNDGTGGNDTLTGTTANNIIYGGDGNDAIYGREGNDDLRGNVGMDTIYGEIGDDALYGGANPDLIVGGDGNDSIRGQEGNDDLRGNAGSDTMLGGENDDALAGGADNDQLFGENGNDTLTGAQGQDQLTGGAGTDSFKYQAATETAVGTPDKILDFEQGIDKIDLSLIDADSAGAGDQAFSFIGSGSFSNAAGQLRVYASGAATWFIDGDVNGDGIADFRVEVVSSASPTSTDFIL